MDTPISGFQTSFKGKVSVKGVFAVQQIQMPSNHQTEQIELVGFVI